MGKNSNQLNKLIEEALAIEARDAKEAGALGYMARALVQATMPHKRNKGNEFIRHNGHFTLTMLAPSEIGLPYGTIPRLLIAWVTTEAVITKERELILGNSLSKFMQKLGLMPTGGRWGSITRLREQMKRLFSSMVSCYYSDEKINTEMGFRIADKHILWWDAKNPAQSGLWESSILLTHPFFEEITSSPVAIDMAALKALKRSPMALDIYCWLTYRMSYLRKVTEIPWQVLEIQFGADYQDIRNFKLKFLQQLRKVLVVYREAKVETGDRGLILKPSKTHVPLILGE